MGYEGELQLSQFDLQETYYRSGRRKFYKELSYHCRSLNFTRSETGLFAAYFTFQLKSPAQQWAPSPCCRWCSSSRDTRATSSSRWGQCWWPSSPIVSKVYLPCALIVVLSWVGFWLNREATSDRVTLGEVLYRGELLKSMSYYYPAS